MLDGSEAIEGGAEFLASVYAVGANILLLTNRTVTPKQELLKELRRVSIACSESQLLTAAEVAGNMVVGKRAFVIGEGGLLQEIAEKAQLVTDERPDVVVVGLDRSVTYRELAQAARFVHAGATFLATNLDPHYYSDAGISPGAGALVAAIATASGVQPIIAGKPGRTVFAQALERLGTPARKTMIIGDNLQTDVQGGRSCGIKTVMLQNRISERSSSALDLVVPDWVCDGFRELSETVFAWFDGSGARPRR